MAVKTSRRASSPASPTIFYYLRQPLRFLPAPLAMLLAVGLLAGTVVASQRIIKSAQVWFTQTFPAASPIAPLFSAPVEYWANDIQRWAQAYNLDPNLLATVMQIESCGHPTVSSYAGAQGLFQVMPFHFSQGENQLDPETNARRGASFLQQCLTNWGKNDPGLALACYNGGPSLTSKPYTQWPNQTQRYYIWGLGIYTDASTNQSSSPTLEAWLKAGGGALCQMADDELGI